jgi:FK506-binding nuclear protein
LQHYQQPLDITIQGNEECFFRVIGGHTVHLTGNYILDDLPDSDEEDEESEEDDEEEYDTLDNMLLNADSDSEEDESEEDELDDLAHPRVMELDDDEVPELIKAAAAKKPTKKRPAEEEVEAVADSAKADDGKASRSKKLKTNDGDAVAAGKNQAKTEETKEAAKAQPMTKKEKKEAKKEAKKSEQNQTNGKKVQFAEKLEQGPTPPKVAPGPRNVNGVMVDDKKMGTGAASKKGDKVGMRYIGKLKDGKVFDCRSCPVISIKLTDDSQQEGLAVQVQDWRRRSHQRLGHWRPRHGRWRRAPYRHSGPSRLRQQGHAWNSGQLGAHL